MVFVLLFRTSCGDASMFAMNGFHVNVIDVLPYKVTSRLVDELVKQSCSSCTRGRARYGTSIGGVSARRYCSEPAEGFSAVAELSCSVNVLAPTPAMAVLL